MTSSLFHINIDGTISQMRETPYVSEDEIQRLLEVYPQVLGSEQYAGAEPRRWLLVAREMPVPDGEGKGGRWALDHLYLDQDGIPTLVEVKRESDSRSRREVVGQMLDYAANGPAFWPIEQLRAAFASTQGDSASKLQALLGEEADVEAFWTTVATNMSDGRVRLVFVVDSMPPELLRIVEFLARHLHNVEVYAVEVRHHMGPSGRLLVTQVRGQTEVDRASATAGGNKIKLRSADEWLAQFATRHGPEATALARELMGWMQERASSTFITTSQSPSFMMTVRGNGKDRYPLYLTSNGKAAVSLGYLAYSPAFESEEARKAVIDRVGKATGMNFISKSIGDDLRVPLVELQDVSRRHAYLATIDWIIGELRTENRE